MADATAYGGGNVKTSRYDDNDPIPPPGPERKRWLEAHGFKRDAQGVWTDAAGSTYSEDTREYKPAGGFEKAERLAEEGREEDRERFEELMGGVEAIGEAGETAGTEDKRRILAMIMKEAGIPDLVAEQYVGDVTSKAAKAKADPFGIAAQKEAAEHARANLTPGLTDAERAMMEITRRKQEQEQRAAREAALSSLQGRGFQSGGDEIAALLGSQQETGERRMLEDLATRGQAVERSERARGDLAGIGSDIRQQSFGEAYSRGTAADLASRTNQQARQIYNQYLTDTRREQNMQEWGRSQDIFGSQERATEAAYGRERDPWEYQAGVTAATSGADAANRKAIIDALMGREGAKQADEAAEMLKPEEGLFGGGGFLGLGI